MKKATIKTPIKNLKKGETIEHYNAVLLEDIKTKMEFVIEGMDAVKSDLKKEMHNLDEKLTGEMELLKTVVHDHSNEINTIRHVISGLDNKIKENNLQIVETNKKVGNLQNELKSELRAVENRLSEKIDNIGKTAEFHKTRLTTVEGKLETHLTAHPQA